jgi:hypothetical protein
LVANRVTAGGPVLLSPYQKVAVLVPLAMLTVVSVVVVNCEAPNFPPAELLERFTVKAPPVVIGVPAPFTRCTVIPVPRVALPRFGVADEDPDTAGVVNTSFPI